MSLDQTAAADERTPLAGQVERVTFHNGDNGFCVLRVKAHGYRNLVTLLGAAPSITAGEYIQASGRWENHREHGLQFRARLLRVTPPTSLAGIERYLGSGLIKGVGPVFAKRLVETFGEQVFAIVEQTPQRLVEVEGIGPKRSQRIIASWGEQKVIREIMAFLQGYGVSPARALRIFKTYGADAIPLVSENPYRLARDITGIGFKSADQIAQQLGISRTAMIRAKAGIAYTLHEATNAGHCGLPEEQLLMQAEQLLEIPEAILSEALQAELASGTVMAETMGGQRCIFLTQLWRAEWFIAHRLHQLLAGRPPWPAIDAERAMSWVEKRLNVTLAPTQRAAVSMALEHKLLVVTGGPGVGKTTLVNAILKILQAKALQVALCAPTGRAAKRLAESTGREASTIHRLLEAEPRQGGFRRNQSNPLTCQLLVVDEVSMVDVPLMAALLKALPPPAALLLVGDADQLSSVGPGQVLADIIHSQAVPVARLTEIFRQAAQSGIVLNAHRVNQGRMPELKWGRAASDFCLVEAEEPEDAARKVVELVQQRIPLRFGFDPIHEVQVLCPMNRGRVGARALNLDLQAALNGDHSGPAVVRFGYCFRCGDKVMQTVNDYDKEVFNGDLGFVHAVNLEAQELLIDFDGRLISYAFGELDEVAPAYAITIHKAQGSEYPAVVMPLSTQHYPMLQRKLLYTGITRGRRLVVLVGQPRALAIAVRASGLVRRWSKLGEWLQGETAPGSSQSVQQG